jgi:MFS family permease
MEARERMIATQPARVERFAELRNRGALLASSAIGLSAGMTATMFYSLGAFIPSLEAEFGWSRGNISLGVTFMTIALFLAGPFAGRLCDRYGAAAVGTLSLVSYAVATIALAMSVDHIATFWIGYFVIAVLGAGSTPIVLIRPISAAFDRSRGIAMGIALTGAGIAGFWVPRLVAEVSVHGWRLAYYALAAVALVAAPIVWFGFRTVPEGSASLAAPAALADGLTLTEARQTKQYWLLFAMGFAMATGIAGLVVHLVPLFRDLGAETLSAARIASTVGLASVGGRLIVGLLLDRYSAPRVALAILSLAAAGIVTLWWAGLDFAYGAVILLGLAAGAEIDLLAYLTSKYFGQRHYGAIYGWQYSVFALGYGLSPFLVGLSRDHWATYDVALLLSAALVLLSALLATQLGPYRFVSSAAATR